MLALSALLIGANWAVYVWGVNAGRVLESSLGYYLTPLLNMAAGALAGEDDEDPGGQGSPDRPVGEDLPGVCAQPAHGLEEKG